MFCCLPPTAFACVRLLPRAAWGVWLWFSCVLRSWDWEAPSSALCSFLWCLTIIKCCPDHHVFSQFNFKNCLNSSELQSLRIQASRSPPVLPSLCIPTPLLLCEGNTLMAETFSILSGHVMNLEMIESKKKPIPTGNFAGHKNWFSSGLCLCCSVVSF